MKSAETNVQTLFEVIPGGLLLESLQAEDVPAPDKPIGEWTPEEHEEYNRYCYENAECGSWEHVIKCLAISPDDLSTTIKTLEMIRDAINNEMLETGYNEFWRDDSDTAFLLSILLQRQKAKS